jgi:hypothetical protein
MKRDQNALAAKTKRVAIRDIKRSNSVLFCMFSTDEVVQVDNAPNQLTHPIQYCSSY